MCNIYGQIRSDQSLSRVPLFVTPWIAACQASLSITSSRSSLRLTSIESVMPSSHLILCHPLLLLPSIPPSIRVFSNESTLRMRWPKYWSFSFSISPSKEIPGLVSFRMAWLDLVKASKRAKCTLIFLRVWFLLPNSLCFLTAATVSDVDFFLSYAQKGLPWWLRWQRICLQCRRPGFNPWVGKIPLEQGLATHSSILAWRNPGTEEPGELQPMGSQSRTWLKWLSSSILKISSM